MNYTSQEKLINYLINTDTPVNEEIDYVIAGMTAQEIVTALEVVKNIRFNLNASSLGRELN
jgi:hypothetical protein